MNFNLELHIKTKTNEQMNKWIGTDKNQLSFGALNITYTREFNVVWFWHFDSAKAQSEQRRRKKKTTNEHTQTGENSQTVFFFNFD